MALYKIKATLKGVFTTIDIILNDEEVSIKEIAPGIQFGDIEIEINKTLHIKVFLKGWTSTEWEVHLEGPGNFELSNKSKFDSSGYVEYDITINF